MSAREVRLLLLSALLAAKYIVSFPAANSFLDQWSESKVKKVALEGSMEDICFILFFCKPRRAQELAMTCQ